ncbi:hypothetical protein CC56_1697 [Bordetella pertussis H934]|nr:hypothetical protein CC56_1697 [Bordetella pertussis H934]
MGPQVGPEHAHCRGLAGESGPPVSRQAGRGATAGARRRG